MNKKTKLIIAFIMACVSALLMPIFTEWYEQETGTFPIAFVMIYSFGGIMSIMAIAMEGMDM